MGRSLFAVLPFLAPFAASAALLGCGDAGRERARAQIAAVTRGDADRGKAAIERYGCGSCHVIPGVDAARGLVGPPLTDFGSRAFIAGQMTNTAPNLVRWIQWPDSVEPGTAMPSLGVSVQDARDMATYLYSETATDELGPPHLLPAELLRAE